MQSHLYPRVLSAVGDAIAHFIPSRDLHHMIVDYGYADVNTLFLLEIGQFRLEKAFYIQPDGASLVSTPFNLPRNAKTIVAGQGEHKFIYVTARSDKGKLTIHRAPYASLAADCAHVKWSECESNFNFVSHVSVFHASSGHIYVFAHYNFASRRVDRNNSKHGAFAYDTLSGEWKQIENHPLGIANSLAFICHDQPTLVGADWDNSMFYYIAAYDWQNQKWSTDREIPVHPGDWVAYYDKKLLVAHQNHTDRSPFFSSCELTAVDKATKLGEGLAKGKHPRPLHICMVRGRLWVVDASGLSIFEMDKSTWLPNYERAHIPASQLGIGTIGKVTFCTSAYRYVD